jgi:hypothetical protein
MIVSKVGRADHHDKSSVTHTVSAAELFEDATQRSAKVLEVSTTKTKRRKHRQASVLDGSFVHTLTADDRLEYQGQIIGVEGDMIICRMFDWVTGYNVRIKPLPKALVFSDRCVIYESREAWLYAAEEYQKRREAAERLAARR